MTDSPDFQNVTQQHNQVIVLETGSIPVGTSTLFSGASSAWASFQIRATTTVRGGVLTVNWFADAALTVGVGSDSWKINHLTGLSAIYPVQAPFCKITFTNPSTAPASGTIYIVGTQLNAESTKYLVSSQFLVEQALSVPLSGDTTFFPSFLARGDATLTINPHDTAGKLRYELQITDNLFNLVGVLIGPLLPTGLTQVNFVVPDQPLALDILNTDATTAHVTDVTLVIANQQ